MEAAAVLAAIGNKIPASGAFLIKEKLEKASPGQRDAAATLGLKSSVVGLILGIFLGGLGVDRFFKGDFVLGGAKLVFIVIAWFIWWLPFLGWAWGILAFVWWIADWFLIWRGIKNDNLNKLLMILG